MAKVYVSLAPDLIQEMTEQRITISIPNRNIIRSQLQEGQLYDLGRYRSGDGPARFRHDGPAGVGIQPHAIDIGFEAHHSARDPAGGPAADHRFFQRARRLTPGISIPDYPNNASRIATQLERPTQDDRKKPNPSELTNMKTFFKRFAVID